MTSAVARGSDPEGNRDVMASGNLLAPFDVIGVGVGPFNLSVAALLHTVPGVRSLFLERNDRFRWHPGLMLPDAATQAPFFKDLVTPVDPTNPLSFLAFLKDKRRLYRYMTARFPSTARLELEEYFDWACGRLGNLQFQMNVEAIEHDCDGFAVTASGHSLRARHLVLGSGKLPRIDERWRGLLGDRVFHSSELLLRDLDLAGKRVAVIGGGQSGAEVFHHLISRPGDLPEELLWISQRSTFLPLDDSPFVNEWFFPQYSDHFYGLSPARRDELLRGQALSSDGISTGLLERIYQRLYLVDLQGPRRHRLLPGHRLTSLRATGGELQLELVSLDDERTQGVAADVVVLCTGYEYRLPAYLEPLRHRIAMDGDGLPVRPDFSLIWDGPARHRIFVQNAARHLRGVAEPNLSLMAWRGAVIANSIIGRPLFDVDHESAAIEWPRPRPAKD